MADMDQFAALVDLEAVIKELAKTTGRPVAIVYDPKGGWCLSDEVKRSASKHGGECPEYGVQTYQDWFSRTIGEAALVAFGIRFLPGTLVGRLFKKPIPLQREEGSTTRGPGAQPPAKAEERRPAAGGAYGGERKPGPPNSGRQQLGASVGQAPGPHGAGRASPMLPRSNRPSGSYQTNASAINGRNDTRQQSPQQGAIKQVTRDGRVQPAIPGERQVGARDPAKRR